MGDQAFYGGGVGETRNNVFQAVASVPPARDDLATFVIASVES